MIIVDSRHLDLLSALTACRFLCFRVVSLQRICCPLKRFFLLSLQSIYLCIILYFLNVSAVSVSVSASVSVSVSLSISVFFCSVFVVLFIFWFYFFPLITAVSVISFYHKMCCQFSLAVAVSFHVHSFIVKTMQQSSQ